MLQQEGTTTVGTLLQVGAVDAVSWQLAYSVQGGGSLLASLQRHLFNQPLLAVAGSASQPATQIGIILVVKLSRWPPSMRSNHICPAGSSSGGRHFLAYTKVGCIVARQDDGFQSLEVSFHDVRWAAVVV